MYPDEKTLIEVGRIVIAAGRLDAALGALWWHLGPDLVNELRARRAPAGRVRDNIRALARERLDDDHKRALLAFVDEVEAAQSERNEVLHSRWLLRGPDSMRPVSEFLRLDEGDRLAYLGAWEREAKESDGWRLQRNNSMALSDPHQLERLIEVERRLARAEGVAIQWHFRIASMRESGVPAGWRGPDEARRRPQPVPPGAVTGPAAEELLQDFVKRFSQADDS